MARLEHIRLPLWRCEVEDNAVVFKQQIVVDPKTHLKMPATLEHLPQLLWATGEFWDEANLWLLARSRLILSGQLLTSIQS